MLRINILKKTIHYTKLQIKTNWNNSNKGEKIYKKKQRILEVCHIEMGFKIWQSFKKTELSV